MGNKNSSSPFPSFEAATSLFEPSELTQIRKQFQLLSKARDTINYEAFSQGSKDQSSYAQKYICPRIFHTADVKKDGLLDFEEFVISIAVFRQGSIEDKIKFLYLMYDGSKSGGSLSKDNLRRMIVDATMCAHKENIPTETLDAWIADIQPLAHAMVESALVQFSGHANKIDITELTAFVKVEGTVQGLLHTIASIVDP